MSVAIHIPVELARITTSTLGLRISTGTLLRGRPSWTEIQPRRAFHQLLLRSLLPPIPAQRSWRTSSVTSLRSRWLHTSSSMCTQILSRIPLLTSHLSTATRKYHTSCPRNWVRLYYPVLHIVVFLTLWARQYHPPFQRPQGEFHQNDRSQRRRRHSIPSTRMGH